MEKNIEIPVWKKINLTPEEASAYSNIGINRIRTMLDKPNCPFIFFVGNRKLIKRKEFEIYLSNQTTV